MKLFCSVFLVLLLLGAQQAQELQPEEGGCNVGTAAADISEGIGNLIGDSVDRLSPPSWPRSKATTKKRKRNGGYAKKKRGRSGGSGKSGGRGKSRRRSKSGRRGKSGGSRRRRFGK